MFYLKYDVLITIDIFQKMYEYMKICIWYQSTLVLSQT